MHFRVIMTKEQLKRADQMPGKLIDYLQLVAYIYTGQMVAYDASGRLYHYKGGAQEILQAFYKARLPYFEKARQHVLKTINDASRELRNKVRFIECYRREEIILKDKSNESILTKLKDLKFDLIPKKTNKRAARSEGKDQNEDKDEQENEKEAEDGEEEQENAEKDVEMVDGALKKLAIGYEYLLSQKLWSLGKAQVALAKAKLAEYDRQIKEYEQKTDKSMWSEDLDLLEVELDKHNAAWQAEQDLLDQVAKKAKKKQAKKGTGQPDKKTKKKPSSKTKGD